MIRTEHIKQLIIKMLGNRDLHGYEVHRELESRDMKIGIGRLYDILKQMRDDGYLNDSWVDSESGPRKRIYTLSKKGKAARESILTDAIQTVHEFYGDYLRNLPEKRSPFNIVSRKLTEKMNSDCVLGYIVNKLTQPINRVLKNLITYLPSSTIYLIGPREVVSENKLDGILILEGNCHDMPIKDEFFDLLVLPSYSGDESIENCVKEWNRVLKPKGRVSVVTPTALIERPEDPLDIGEFIEQQEHPSKFNGSMTPIEELKKYLEQHFGNIATDSVIHITLLSSTK
ncbi:MAG: helix-turn-helix transcriptional regulator [Candidatus Thorarchaeota archaeon]